MRWEKTSISFPVAVDTNQIVARSLERQLRAWSRWSWQSWDEAATYLLENHCDLKVALGYAGHSVQVEERFENLMTQSQILSALGRKEEGAATREKALSLAGDRQLHNYGMGLISEGRQEEAFEVFQFNIKKHPDTLLAYIESARIASGRGDFEEAIKRINSALAIAPEGTKANLQILLRQLQNGRDINR